MPVWYRSPVGIAAPVPRKVTCMVGRADGPWKNVASAGTVSVSKRGYRNTLKPAPVHFHRGVTTLLSPHVPSYPDGRERVGRPPRSGTGRRRDRNLRPRRLREARPLGA